METKGLTCKIPLDLHNRISEEIKQNESTMSKFIEQIILEHYAKGATTMGKTRTMAFQVSEELFQQIKEYLARYALNLHSVFYHGTVEWRCFESTLHAGEVRADITLALAMSAQAINLEKTVARKTPVGDNPAFAFRTFLLRLGLIGPEYKNVRMHLLKRLPGDPAWLRDRNQYESYQRRHTRGDAR